ncbi:MAG: leucine-rich repeat domain-containing protein [Gemmobacter sp.]
MANSDYDYAEAERRIAAARTSGATELDLSSLHRLTRLPDSIGSLTALTALNLWRTPVTELFPLAVLTALTRVVLESAKVTDLSPLAFLNDLTTLDLSGTPVTNLMPLAQLTNLTSLSLGATPVSDLKPLAHLASLRTLHLWKTPVANLTPLSQLTSLTTLEFWQTLVTDLAPLATLTALTTLNLSGTPVTDLAPLATLTALTTLGLSHTQVTDLTPLSSLTALRTLNLRGAKVTDLAPLSALPALTTLSLAGSRVTDLGRLATLPTLSTLDLRATQVTDLAPIAALTGLRGLELAENEINREGLRGLAPFQRLISDPGPNDLSAEFCGLNFTDTAAVRSDPRIAKIAGIEDPATRARTLFDYLGLHVDGPATQPQPEPPPRRSAPLEITVTDSHIRMAGPGALPEHGANDRAAMGWEALRDHRQAFARAFHVHNYHPLPAYLDDFDAAMGTAYDPRHVIRIGVQGLRIAALSRNAAFVATLPVGADSDLVAFAATIDLHVRRFPDWVAYRDDADPDDVSPRAALAAAADYRAIDHIFQTTPQVEDTVRAEYRAEVTAATGENADPPAAQALTASTGEIARALAEHGTAEAARKRRNRDLARKGGDLWDKTVLAPLGLGLHVMKRIEGPLRRLARRYPNRMGWIDAWYDATFPPDDPPRDP